MPLPKPSDEKESEFVSRCMSDNKMSKEFPNNKQRVAVCHSMYRKAKKSKGSVDWDDVSDDPFIIY